MAMDPEVKDYLETLIKSVHSEIRALKVQFRANNDIMDIQFKNIDKNFERVDKKQDYGNGRTNDLEKKVDARELYCSAIQASKVGYDTKEQKDMAEKKQKKLESNNSLLRWFQGIGLLVAAASFVAMAYFRYLDHENLSAMRPLVEQTNNQTREISETAKEINTDVNTNAGLIEDANDDVNANTALIEDSNQTGKKKRR